MNELQILESALLKAKNIIAQKEDIEFDTAIIQNVDGLIVKIDKHKSQICALVTSLIKKATTPEQDVRLHRTDFEGGYSARSLDTKITTPFFKRYFPRYANKESAFLTLSTREKVKWSLDEGASLKIRDADFKNSFLNLFQAIEDKIINPNNCLTYLFIKLLDKSKDYQNIYEDFTLEKDIDGIFNINTIIELLENHFKISVASRLPVVAIYSAYIELFKQMKRYEGKTLLTLNVHTASDKHGYGDIEIKDENNEFFEIIEIKHRVAIDRNHILDIVKKCENSSVKRYYILTTFEKCFASKEEAEHIKKR